MKLRFILPSVIFLFFGLAGRAQVTEMLYQGFEVGETEMFTSTPAGSTSYSTSLHVSGNRSLELNQSSSGDVTLLLNVLDFTQNTSLRYISLEFDHICDVPDQGSLAVCRIYYKRENEPEANWHQMTQQHYDRTDGGASYFNRMSSFDKSAYSDWLAGNLGNENWKHERFNLNEVMTSSVAASDRKLMIKFVIRQSATSTTGKWRFDNLRINASPNQMVAPTIKMVSYPDGYYYPSSRGAWVMLDASTNLATGINPDSVYLVYRVANNPTQTRLYMQPVSGVAGRYAANIPFFGYDTLMRFYCVVRDATTNANMITYPKAANSWVEYKCVRGFEQNGVSTPAFTGVHNSSSAQFPFNGNADGRSEWVYDSALMMSGGYKRGELTAMKFTWSQHTNAVTIPRMQVRMKNVETNYQVDTTTSGNYPFTLSYMKVVYDGPFVITESNANGEQLLSFQDTFFYAGKDLVMQLVYDGTVDVTPSPVKMIASHPLKKSFFFLEGTAEYGHNPFAPSSTSMNVGDMCKPHRPALVLTEKANPPLLYDMGVSELVSPSYEVPMTPNDHSVQVKLKNFGALTANAIRISYLIDNNIGGHYDWTGNLAGGAEQNVTIATNVPLGAGFHTLCVWVEDTLTAAGQQYRDHEPYNDTMSSEFIVCAGPMNGVRRIGGTAADFNTMEEFLFALSRCGINDSLVVKLAPGYYQPFTMPSFDGGTPQHYVAFEPASGSVTFFSADTVEAIADLSEAAYLRFRNINFVRRSAPLTNMVKLGLNSTGCQFEGCTFTDSLANPAANMRIDALLSTGYANSILVDGCTFVGGKTGIDLRGYASDNLATNNTVRRSLFENQYECAINATSQSGMVIEKNEMYNVLSNTSYVLLLNTCSGQSRVVSNKLYTSHGAGAIGLNSVSGTSISRFLVANNMVVCNDDGNANLMRSPFNVITANWTDVVYNSVKMTAPQRNNIAAVTFGGGTLQNSRFLNNIVVSLDQTNYALNFSPGANMTNEVGHNDYYSMGAVLNRKSGASSPNLAAWQMSLPADSLSISVNPNFLNGSLVDLRTFNRLIKGVGIPMATVPTDMFDTLRGLTSTCVGAFEFSSLQYDFEPEALVSPEGVTCHMPGHVELKVKIRNSGTSSFHGSGLSLGYRVNNGGVLLVPITDSIPAEDTVTVSTGAMLQLPPNANSDATYNISVWTIFSADPNQTNDTNVFQVTSKYHPSKPADDSTLINYATAATITPTTGVDTWQVYDNTAAPRKKSELYWYSDTNDAAPIFVGNTFVTDTIRMDTTFYFRQKRNLPIVRITQVEFAHANNTVGLTPSMPYWINSGRKVALQLTNRGDAPANLEGDTLRLLVATTSSGGTINVKDYVFGDVTIAPGASLVVQTATGVSSNPTMTVHTGSPMSTVAINSSSNCAFIYKHGDVVEDVVAMNSVTTTALNKPGNWNQQNIPSYVWLGSGVTIPSGSTTAGLIRTSFDRTASAWSLATNANPMFLNTNNPNWILYTDNGCDGYFAKYKVNLIAPPMADIDLDAPILPASTCGMGMENVSVRVHNYGIQSVGSLVLNYCAGGDTVTETMTQPIAANGAVTYTFNGQVNLSFPHDSLVTVKVWADSIPGDPTNSNDTSVATLFVPFTPAAPVPFGPDTVSYADRDTTMLTPIAGLVPVWYDYDGIAVDTGYTSVSEILYVGGTRGVSYMVSNAYEGTIGTGATQNGVGSYPTPYQPKTKHAKQQYIYSAHELRAAGLKRGYIDSLAFNLKAIGGNATSISFNEYSISMGSTNDTIFASNTDWKSTRLVYSRAPMVLTQADCNTWVTHRLDSPFFWDGESSVVVQIVHYIATALTGAQSTYTTKSNTAISQSGANPLTPTTAEYVGNGSRSGNRPNIHFNNTVFGCTGPITPYTIQMINIPAVDMAVLWPNGVDTLEYNSCNDIPIYVNVRNQGSTDATGTKLYYYFDTLAVDSITVSSTIVSGETYNTQLFSRHMMPGRHTVKVIVSAPGDLIHSNDTIVRSFMVRFCNGSYTIATTGGDYRSFGEAIDTLNIVGIQGPVVFNVAPGTYNEQVILNSIPGSSSENTIGFVGTGDDVLLTAATTQTDNYVMLLDSTSYVTLSNFRIESRPTATGGAGNYANALVVNKGGHITIDSLTVRVKGTINNMNASCVVLQGGVSDLTFTHNVIDSGYYSFRSHGNNYSNLTITNNTFKNFWFQGVYLRGVNNLQIDANEVTSGVTVTGRGLTGLYLAQTEGSFSVQKNKIYLIDDKNGGKRGIQLESINSIASNPGLVANNMISCSGTGTAGLTPAKPSGIWIDSASTYVNVYFNTVRVYCGPYTNNPYSDASYSFYSGPTVSHIQVMNNIFANLSKGYAYYVSELNTISISNYNAYYSAGTRPLAWKQTTIANLAGLQAANTDDANSVFDEPYFVSDNDLHLVMTNYSGIAQYNTDVPDDIDGNVRQQVPGPTIGAHEMPVVTHDMAVVRIYEPVMPASINFNPPNNMPPYIEGDSILVKAKFYNNGQAPENNVQWYAYLEGHYNETYTGLRDLGSFAPGASKIDSVMMPTALGIIDTNILHVVVLLPADSSLSDNDRTQSLWIAPAFNLAATQMSTDHSGCNMENTEVRIHVKNAGFKDFPINVPFKIGFVAEVTSPTNTTVPTMPTVPVEEYVTLTNPLLMGQTTIISFTQPANFYPTDIDPAVIESNGMKFRLRGWVNYSLDITQTNDSTSKNSSPISSYYTPVPPVGYDTTFDYGTWGVVRASQENSRPIRWYRDTTASPFYSPSSYSASCRWTNTPQYFHDSVYYLACSSAKNCPSHFSTVNVHVAPLVQNDIAFVDVLAPLGHRVYMENDTVRVRIQNYGNRAQSNFQLTYQLKKGNNLVQTVTETCTATVAPLQTYDFTFNELLDISTPTTSQNYSLTVWTDLSSDEVRRNDTIRAPYTFHSLPESSYNPGNPEHPSFDITRVSFNEFDFECPQLGRGLTNLASYSSPDYPVVHVTRGLTDSLLVQVTPLDGTAQTNRVKIWVFIDFNRDGVFNTTDEMLVSGDAFYDNTTFKTQISISNNASYGYMRMRVAVGSYSDFSTTSEAPVSGIPSNKSGHNIDALLFVDANPPTTDLAVTQIVAPRSYLIRDDQPRTISFRIANKGTDPISNPTFTYHFTADVDSVSHGTVTYNGTLQPGTSAVLALPPHVFPLGVSDLTIWHEYPGDTNYENNQINFQYNRFHIVRLVLNDNFDVDNKWYAPVGYNLYSHNFWELGTPNKSKLNAAYSEPNAWVTDLNNTITTGTRGNVSYLYSPIINISQIKADTLSFRLRRNLNNGSSLRLEFYNYENKWVNVNTDSLSNWYNNEDDECFDNSTAGTDYNYYWIPTNLISGDFPELLQFRFVYTTPIKSSPTAAFGEGCAVDNFHVGRARRPVDAGVESIVYPTAPAYGQTICPRVVVHNYGTDTLRSFTMGYIHYGTYLPKQTTITNCRVAPGGCDTFSFAPNASFIVTSDFPDTFNITAFTLIQSDIYHDNDSCTQAFPLSPLENDISAHSFLYPLDNVVAGDSLQVTLRIRNFGSSPITTATASYIVNGQMRVDEEIDFNAILGHPLGSMQYFNYTFRQRFRAPMGVVKLTGIIKSPQNDYVYNDTVSKRVEGINSVLDIAAAAVIVDTSSHTVVRISLVIENRGARGANGFEVGYYIDDNTDTIYREFYGRDVPIPGLQTGYYSFNATLPRRSAGYRNVTAFVHALNDNDRSNDTTKFITTQYFDIEMEKIIIIENAQPDCQVIAVIHNNGNIPLMASTTIHVDGYINGTRLSDNFNHAVMAGQTVSLIFPRHRVPKSPVRHYEGSLATSISDADSNNNQTNLIEIRGHWEDAPVVETNTLVLDQNFPNPFNDRTTIPFTLPNDADVRFFIIDAMGHIVNSFTRHYSAGAQSLTVDMSAYPAGIYYYGIEVDGQRRMKKMLLR